MEEREQVDKPLRESEEWYESLVESIQDGLTVIEHGKVTYVNDRACEIFGYPRDELVKLTGLDVAAPEEKEWLKRIMEESRVTGIGPKELEFWVIRKDGTRRYIHNSYFVIRKGDELIRIAVSTDITERKKMEVALAHERDLLHILMDNIPYAIYFKDVASRFTRINRAHAQRMGVNDPKEAIGKMDSDFYPAEFAREAYADEQKIVKTGEPLINKVEKIRRPYKQFRWVSATKVPILNKEGQVTGIVGISRDITERKKIEEASQKSEERWRSLVELAPDVIVTVNMKGMITSCNTATARMSGYSKDEIIGKHISKIGFLRAGDLPKYRKLFNSIVRGKVPEPFEVTWHCKNGALRFSEVRISLMTEGGRTVGLQAIARDITERKEMEEKLRQYSEHLEELVQKRTEELLESERRYSVLVEEASDGVVILQDGRIVFANKKAPEIAGYSRDEVIGVPFEKLVDEKYHQLTKERYIRRLRGEAVPSTYEIEIIAKTGERVPIELGGALIHYQGRPADLVIVRDVRERKRMEEERLRLERLAAIGEAAAMVGHDLRNPLQAMVNTLFLTKMKLKSLPIADRKIIEKHGFSGLGKTLEEQVGHMNKIVSDLQDYVKPVKPEPVETSLPQLINDALSTITVPENVKVSIMIEEGFLKLMVDPTLMKRVFTNLVTNALQAMPDGGQLTIKSSKTGETAFISVQDTGVGIPAEDLPKLFQPLFTTKSRGLGFGLLVCKRLVEAHNGSITVESKVGKGSTFTVKIPLRREAG